MPELTANWVDGKCDGLLEFATRSYAEDCHSSPVGYFEDWYVYVDKDLHMHGHNAWLLQAAENWVRSGAYTEIAFCDHDLFSSNIGKRMLDY